MLRKAIFSVSCIFKWHLCQRNPRFSNQSEHVYSRLSNHELFLLTRVYRKPHAINPNLISAIPVLISYIASWHYAKFFALALKPSMMTWISIKAFTYSSERFNNHLSSVPELHPINSGYDYFVIFQRATSNFSQWVGNYYTKSVNILHGKIIHRPNINYTPDSQYSFYYPEPSNSTLGTTNRDSNNYSYSDSLKVSNQTQPSETPSNSNNNNNNLDSNQNEFVHTTAAPCDDISAPPTDNSDSKTSTDPSHALIYSKNSNDLFKSKFLTKDLFNSNFIPKDLFNYNFVPEDLFNSNIIPEDLSNSDIIPKNLSNSNFISKDLSNSNIISKDLSNSNIIPKDLFNSNIIPKDLSNSNCISKDLSNSNFIPKDLSNSNCISKDLFNSNIISKDLSNSNIIPKDLSNSNCISKDLSNSNIISKDLSNSNFIPKDLSNSNIISKDLFNSHYLIPQDFKADLMPKNVLNSDSDFTTNTFNNSNSLFLAPFHPESSNISLNCDLIQNNSIISEDTQDIFYAIEKNSFANWFKFLIEKHYDNFILQESIFFNDDCHYIILQVYNRVATQNTFSSKLFIDNRICYETNDNKLDPDYNGEIIDQNAIIPSFVDNPQNVTTSVKPIPITLKSFNKYANHDLESTLLYIFRQSTGILTIPPDQLKDDVYNLGIATSSGRGMKFSIKKSLPYFEKGASLGHIMSDKNLEIMQSK